ncbi:hypothetical protein [Bacillus sp. YKCMOAS1]|uniref:hypothetical protein n=1 Tax=Bacillus sp. YKCMOAS1 TaxID=2925778 RepID=UPI00253F344E|nr:hypothetical protein [Bacillus sp. YKCMOAS1]GLJ02682.1 hypothetical protein OAS1_19310 [Bacillus sp. YKCMOAS1]
MLIPLRIGIGKKSWERDAKRIKDKAAVFEENADLMGTVVFWAYGRKAREEEVQRFR